MVDSSATKFSTDSNKNTANMTYVRIAGNIILSFSFVISCIISKTITNCSDIPIICMILTGLLSCLMGFRLSLFRLRAQTKRDGILSSNEFTVWSKTQLNNAEWSPIIMILELTLHILSKDQGVTFLTCASCVWANISSLMYVYGSINSIRNMSVYPMRFAGALGRYFSIFLMLFQCWTMLH